MSNQSTLKALYNLNFHTLDVVSRYRDAQIQVDENFSLLFHFRPNNYKYKYLNTHFIYNNGDLFG